VANCGYTLQISLAPLIEELVQRVDHERGPRRGDTGRQCNCTVVRVCYTIGIARRTAGRVSDPVWVTLRYIPPAPRGVVVSGDIRTHGLLRPEKKITPPGPRPFIPRRYMVGV
jgi:hypothetical protein